MPPGSASSNKRWYCYVNMGGLSLGVHQLRVDVCLNNEPGFAQAMILESLLGFTSIITARASDSFNKC